VAANGKASDMNGRMRASFGTGYLRVRRGP
jgi:hypothetical protein